MTEDRVNTRVALARVEGEMKALAEVVRMNMAEQKRIYDGFVRVIEKHEKKDDDLDTKITKVENKVYYFSGAAAMLSLFLNRMAKTFGVEL